MVGIFSFLSPFNDLQKKGEGITPSLEKGIEHTY
jgi:hypothetical protein